jgi:hypothetical protein
MTRNKEQEFSIHETNHDYKTNQKLDHKMNQENMWNKNLVRGRKS